MTEQEGKIKVMVLDDEHIAVKTLQRVLGKAGYQVEAFEDPHQALARLEETCFDIVVTDVVMGDIDGIQVLNKVRQVCPQTRVIIITAFAMMEMARKAMEKGAFDFVAKPFDAQAIREVVDRAARQD
ncbi:MAG: response regulator [Deltaproteobacteria bacterium]|nr:MAG: response regulator [Deltaproteobacteria bacterium]